MLDSSGQNSFWYNIFQFHKISNLSKRKFNFLMHYLNTQHNTKQISLFLNDREKFQMIKNEDEDV